ncbi:DUF4221 family protein [Algoriphagus antarcticus]|uniref:Uncharacterized protein DUF4221 n=1 Tax=Algoriphagus antarcticus TaxID=238540 RepID=A0A3E0DTR9_9BACT|nr:DUF4221 family protein [Algoriphagus antarcticus]REG86298.1 uncharacterized protein DUF4221 [Algoriphagus antarcticus]
MKKLLTISLLALLSACGGKESATSESGNILENLTFSVDTLVVDAKNEIINLSSGAFYSSVSLDLNSYYYFERDQALLNEIDLDKLELVGKHAFSKEGPNSIGFNPPSIYALKNERFLFVSPLINVATYFKNGEKEKNLKFNFREIEGLNVDEEGLITNQAILSHDEKYLFALAKSNPSSSEVQVMVIDHQSKTGRTISLPRMVETLKFSVRYSTPDLYMYIGERVHLQILNEKLFITSTAYTDIYVYDYLKNSLQLVEFPHRLVLPRQAADIKNEVNDEKEFEAEGAKILYQTGYEKFLWDDQRQQYFRIGRKKIQNENKVLEERFDIFLFTYDSYLNLLVETQLDDLNQLPQKPFFKDGKLYSYVNEEDELGFAVFTFNY